MADISGKCDQQTYGKIDQMVTTSSKFAEVSDTYLSMEVPKHL